MRSRRTFLLRTFGASLVWLGLANGAATLVRAADFVVIRNGKNPSTSVSKPELKDMAVGKKKVWGHGAPVLLVLGAPGSAEMSFFASTLLGVPEATLMSKIKQEVFKGEMKKPAVATSDKDVIAAVAQDSGALGVVSAEAAKALPASVAVLAVQ